MTDPTFSDELAKHSAPVVLPAAELARLRKIEAAVMWIEIEMDGPDSWVKVTKLIDRLRPLLETETDG